MSQRDYDDLQHRFDLTEGKDRNKTRNGDDPDFECAPLSPAEKERLNQYQEEDYQSRDV